MMFSLLIRWNGLWVSTKSSWLTALLKSFTSLLIYYLLALPVTDLLLDNGLFFPCFCPLIFDWMKNTVCGRAVEAEATILLTPRRYTSSPFTPWAWVSSPPSEQLNCACGLLVLRVHLSASLISNPSPRGLLPPHASVQPRVPEGFFSVPAPPSACMVSACLSQGESPALSSPISDCYCLLFRMKRMVAVG